MMQLLCNLRIKKITQEFFVLITNDDIAYAGRGMW